MKRSALIRYLTLILSILMVLSLFACDNKNEGDKDKENRTDAAVETDGKESGDGEDESDPDVESEKDTGDGESAPEQPTDPETENRDGFEDTDEQLYLSAQRLYVYASPSFSAEKVGTLVFGDRIDIVAYNSESGWYKIALGESVGYIPIYEGYFSAGDPTADETDGSDETDPEEETECYHPYAATEEGHYKPACSVCGKKDGKVQQHEYAERVDDGGDVWIYAFACTVCDYVAYEHEVSYSINAFYAPGELSAVDTDATFSGSFAFEMGTGFALFTMGSGGSGTVKVVESQDAESESGRYMVMKVRLPSSQSRFSVSVRSLSASKSYSMVFEDLKPGWVTVIADMTTAVTTGSDGTKTGYHPNADGEYYLSYLGINGRVLEGEHFDVAYVMICDSIEDAKSFTANEKQVFAYSDVVSGEREFFKKPCVDKDGNEIKHSFISTDEGHSVSEPCYQCGLEAVENEPHTYTQMRVNGELTYACSVCEHLQFGYYLNKYISAEEINKNALVYYKIDRTLMTEGEHSYPRFTGRGQTAQVIFARNNWATANAPDQVAAAFSVGRGDLLVIRMRTNTPSVKFIMMLGGIPGKEKEVVLPTSLATVVSESGAESVEYGWTTYVIDLPRAIQSVYPADENGEYKLHNFYFQIGTGSSGADFTSDVYYDIDYMAFVDSWDEIKNLVVDETVVKVNATADGTIVKTQEQECVGEHSWGENVDGNVYSYLCVNCGKNLKTVTLPECVKQYFSGYEVARNAVTYAAAPGYVGEKSVGLDGDVVFGSINYYSEIWWSRHQQDYNHGTTGAALNNKYYNVGSAKYFVVRMRNTNNQKNVEFYISTTGRNGEGYAVAPDGTETRPTSSGMITLTSPAQAATAGEWTTYVFDLEALIPEYYVRDPESGDYIIDTFGIARSRDDNVTDIEFMAFVEGGWEEIDSITPDETVVFATDRKTKTYSILKTANGACEICSCEYKAVSGEDGSVSYEYRCAVCGTLASAHKVSADINKYYALDAMTKYGATDNGIKEESGVVYHSFAFNGSAGHIFVNGSNGYTDMGDDTGSLLVLKYRAAGDASVTLEVGTEDKNVIGSWGTAGSVDCDVSVSRLAGKISTGWCVAVIDLSVYNYTCNADQNVQVRLTTASSSIDIAYVAIVDSEDEAKELIDGTLDSSYVYYSDWKGDGEIKSVS